MAPFGIERFKGKDAVLKEALNVPKGTTNWQVLSTFCKKALGTVPRVESDGSVNLNGIEKGGELFFSNIDGVKYNSIKENIKRHPILYGFFTLSLRDRHFLVLNIMSHIKRSTILTNIRGQLLLFLITISIHFL